MCVLNRPKAQERVEGMQFYNTPIQQGQRSGQFHPLSWECEFKDVSGSAQLNNSGLLRTRTAYRQTLFWNSGGGGKIANRRRCSDVDSFVDEAGFDASHEVVKYRQMRKSVGVASGRAPLNWLA